jgi:pyruvate/2-oxoglutarate dehydrogenase complex dihydrolipoamide dehydrogenase (E3) component
MGKPEVAYDAIVIGADPAGENVADRTIKGYLRAALGESELVGGSRSYFACIPGKALLRRPAALEAARRPMACLVRLPSRSRGRSPARV